MNLFMGWRARARELHSDEGALNQTAACHQSVYYMRSRRNGGAAWMCVFLALAAYLALIDPEARETWPRYSLMPLHYSNFKRGRCREWRLFGALQTIAATQKFWIVCYSGSNLTDFFQIIMIFLPFIKNKNWVSQKLPEIQHWKLLRVHKSKHAFKLDM